MTTVVVALALALLIVRILLLLSLDEDSGLVRLVVSLSEPLVGPFAQLFHIGAVRGADGSILDLAALVSLSAGSVIGALLLRVVADVRRNVAGRPKGRASTFLPSP